jgi:FkbM family methyltransferase
MADFLEIAGLRIPNDPAVITPPVARAIENGRYERAEMAGLRKFVKPEDRIIELGAGIGVVSAFLAREMGVKNILCIEANPSLCAFITRVHRANGIAGVEVRNAVALDDLAEARPTATFYVREPFWASSLDGEAEYERAVEVPALRLSELIGEFRADTLIVDIEGGERDLFTFAELAGIDKVFLEIHTRKIKRIGVKMCFDALSLAGFAYDQQVSRGGLVLFRRIPKWQMEALEGETG